MKSPASALVTGGAGFVGRALIRRLAQQGSRVLCLSRVANRLSPDVPPGVTWIRAGTHDPATLRSLLADFSPEVVFNLAAYGVSPDDRDVSAMIDGNVAYLADLLQAIADRPPRRFIQTGSCSEYGPAIPGTRLREDHCTDPTSLYGASKASATMLGGTLARQLAIPFVTVRLFGIYGPGEAPHRLIPYLVARLRRDEQVDMTPGEQSRDFLYIDDVVDALCATAVADGIRDFERYNVCSGAAVRIRDIATTVCQLLGKPTDRLALGARPYRADEPMWIVGDPSRFRAATGWTPGTSLEAGIRRTLLQLTAS